ncbi:MAG: hypothetical protein ACT4QG_10435 [Sporichthyaceae bacterium]
MTNRSNAAERRVTRARAVLLGAVALNLGVLVTAAMPTVASAANPKLTLKSVKVFDEGTVDTTFSNPMDPAKLREEQFQAPHYYWVVPHTHIAVAFQLLNKQRTVRTVLDRGLHPIKGRCVEDAANDPRCSIDTLNWEVVGATDIYGQTITDKKWKVWTIGAKKHPAACRPGCP